MSDRALKALRQKMLAFERRKKDFLAGFEAGRAGPLSAETCWRNYAKETVSKEKLIDEG